LAVDISKARFETFEEGLCVHMMHIGPYANEPETVARIDRIRWWERIRLTEYSNF